MDEGALVEFVREGWETGPIHAIERLTGGEWNDVWRLSCADGEYVLRLSNEQMSRMTVEWEHRVLGLVADRSAFVHAPLRRTDSAETLALFDGRAATVFPFVRGDVPRGRRQVLPVAAATLGELHRTLLKAGEFPPRPGQPALAELDWDRNHLWTWDVVQRRLDEGLSALARDDATAAILRRIVGMRELIDEERAWVEGWIHKTSDRDPTRAVIHGDFYGGNLLVDDGRVTGVVDWDEAHPDWLAYELGWSAWEFASDEHSAEVDDDAYRAFVGDYRAAGGPVPDSEDDLLIPSVRCRHLIEVLWALGRGVFDASYCLRGLEAIALLRDRPKG